MLHDQMKMLGLNSTSYTIQFGQYIEKMSGQHVPTFTGKYTTKALSLVMLYTDLRV